MAILPLAIGSSLRGLHAPGQRGWQCRVAMAQTGVRRV